MTPAANVCTDIALLNFLLWLILCLVQPIVILGNVFLCETGKVHAELSCLPQVSLCGGKAADCFALAFRNM